MLSPLRLAIELVPLIRRRELVMYAKRACPCRPRHRPEPPGHAPHRPHEPRPEAGPPRPRGARPRATPRRRKRGGRIHPPGGLTRRERGRTPGRPPNRDNTRQRSALAKAEGLGRHPEDRLSGRVTHS